MARLTFPDEGSRLLYDPATGFLLPVNTRVYLYLDSAGTQPATDLQDMAGVAITVGYVASDAYRRLPLFQGPASGVDTLWAVVGGTGPITPIYARDDDRIDALNTRVTVLETDSPATAVQSVNGHTGTAVTVTKGDVGLGNVDNTSDVNKPVSTAQAAADALAVPLTQRGAVNGVATLDGGGKIPTVQLPPLAINDTFTVNSQAAMLALTAQRGDAAVRTDLSPAETFMLTADDPTQLANWVQITTAGAVTSVFGRVGAVALAKADVTATGLAAADVGADATGAATAAQTAAIAASSPRLTRTAVKTANYAAVAGDLVPCDTTSAAFTVTLPNAPAVGSRVAVKLVTLGAGHAVTIACAGSDVFNKTGGVTSGTLTLLNQALQVQYDTGGIWTVVSDDLPKSALDGAYAALLTPTATKTANYTAVPGDLVVCDTTSAAFTVTLPTTPADAARIGAKIITQGGTNGVTIAAGGTDRIATGAATTRSLKILGEAVELQYQASTGLWFIAASDTPVGQLDLRYGALAGGNTFTGSQTVKQGYLILDRSTEGFNSAPEEHFLGANGGAYIGIDVANTPYSRDWVLYGKPGTYGFTDAATTSGSPLITSAAYANFTATQVGKTITGTGIPAATTIARLPSTTIAVASNGAVLPQGTINVADTTDFASAGTLYIDSASARSIITYTGKTSTTFTGCTGGTATLATGNTVSTTTQAVLSANATATATGVAVVITDSGVYDQIYCSHRGGASPTFGLGVTPPSGNYRVQISPADSEPLMGGLYIRIGPSQKTKSFTIGDSGGTDRVTIDQQGVVVGNTISWGEGLTIQALPTGANNIALRLADKTGTATTMTFYWSSSFVNIKAGGRDIFTIDGSGNLQIKGGFLSFFGAAASVGRQTISGSRGGNAALASLLTALASLGLITDSTTA